jgi:transposase
MAKPKKLSEKTVARAQQQSDEAQTAKDLRKVLAVLLPAKLGVSQQQAAEVLGIGVATVKRYQNAAHRQAHGLGEPSPGSGGRRNETIPLEFEKNFLALWTQRAETGEVVLVQQLREDLQRQAGRRIPMYTMYRILARHGWRKVAPDTKHPKGDPAAREAFKKTSAPCWSPPGAKTAGA